MNKRIRRKMENGDRKYKNEKQLSYAELLCKRPLNFQHAVEESYPEIEIYIKPEYKPSEVKEKLEPVLRNAGYNERKVSLEPYDTGERGYNELLLLFDYRFFTKKHISKSIRLIQETVKPYASLVDVEAQYSGI